MASKLASHDGLKGAALAQSLSYSTCDEGSQLRKMLRFILSRRLHIGHLLDTGHGKGPWDGIVGMRKRTLVGVQDFSENYVDVPPPYDLGGLSL